MRLWLGFNRLHFLEDDVEHTYGAVSAWSLDLIIPIRPGVEGLVGAGYAHTHGDPYYGSFAFAGHDNATLTFVPIEFGIVLHEPSGDKHRINVGVLFQEIWVRERIAHAVHYEGQPPEALSGWGWGVRAFLGPEWFLADRRYAIGFDVSFAARSTEISKHGYERSLSLTGAEWRLHVARCF